MTSKKHIVVYNNNDNSIIVTVQYKGQKPIRAILKDKNKGEESGLLLDYIQLVIFKNDLSIKSFYELAKS